MTIQDRVARGVALLDERSPGWVNKVSLNKLNMWSSADCIVGQVLGNYCAGIRVLGLDTKGAANHGFQADLGTRITLPAPPALLDLVARDYTALTAEWRRVITILQQETPAEQKELTLV